MSRLVPALLCALVVTGCGGGDKDADKPMPKASATPSLTPGVKVVHAKQIDEATAGRVKPRMPEEQVISLLGSDPILRQRPTPDFAGGCIFYPIRGQPLSNVWQFCFNKRGIQLVVTALSPEHPDPPPDASEARAVLIPRADAVCQSEYGYLSKITEKVSAALDAFARKRTPANRNEAGRQIGRFIANLHRTNVKLAAFEPPPDKGDVLTAYLDSLREQEQVLRDARSALLDGDIGAYQDLGTRFSEIGDTAKQQAKDYGLTTCRASRWAG